MIIFRKSPSVYLIQDPFYKFLPGNNIVPSAIEKEVMENKYNQDLIKGGVHETVYQDSEDIVKDNKTKVDEIKSLSTPKAVKVISDCMDYELLTQLSENDKRKEIQKVVSEQLKKLQFSKEEKATAKASK